MTNLELIVQLYMFFLLVQSSEPVGSVAPKIAGENIQIIRVYENKSLSILCPAQGFPTPVYR